jgi:hypothetical protein
MRKIDKFQNAINHGVTQSDEGVHEAQNDAVQKYLGQDF